MYSNINLIIILIILIRSIKQVLNLEQFNCDTPQKLAELKQLDTKRFLLIKDKIYLITNDKVYSFGIPYYFKDEDNYYFIKRQSFVQKYEEKSYDYDKLKGYITIDSLGYTFEINLAKENNEQVISINKIESDLTRLKIEEFLEFYYVLIKGILDRNLSKKNSNLELLTGYLSDVIKENMKYFQVKYIDNKIEILVYKNLSQVLDKKLFTFERNYDIKFAINYLFDSNYDEDKIKRPYSIIEFDNKYFQIYQFDSNFNYLSPYKISVEEFFNCNNKINDDKDIKGILYKDNVFFIFINQFYIQINESKLIENNFKIDSNLNDIKYLKFQNRTIQESILFETNYTKWLKTVENHTYLITYNRTFEIKFTGSELKFHEIHNLPSLKYCPKQTLVIDNHLFCFIKNQYYYLDTIDLKRNKDFKMNTNLLIHNNFFINGKNLKTDNQIDESDYDNFDNDDFMIKNRKKREYKIPFLSHSIGSIFKNTGIDYDNNEVVELIFNYKDNKFVMMTKSNAYIIGYDSIKYSTDEKQLIINKDAKITKIKSYLFKNPTIKSKLLERLFFAFIILIIVLITSIIAHKGSRRFLKEKINNYLYKVRLSDQEIMAKYSFPDAAEKQNNLPSIQNKSNEDRLIAKALVTKSSEDKLSKNILPKTKSSSNDIRLAKLKSPSLKSNLQSNKILTKVSKNSFKLTNKAPNRSYE